MRRPVLPSIAVLPVLAIVACSSDPPPVTTGDVALARAWTSETFAGCVLASPLEHELAGVTRVIVATGDGRIVALDPSDGTTIWDVALPEDPGEMAHVIATPVVVGDRLIVAWQDVMDPSPDPAATTRFAHHVGAIDLARGELDAALPIVDLAAEQPSADGTGTVVFSPGNALSRSRLVHATTADRELGLVYVSFGNARDIQPWHGWIFELDLDAWRDLGAGSAIAAVLLTSPTNDCGPSGVSGSADMICGAGVWSPAGPLLVPDDAGSFDLIVPAGNGALDLDARSYAHTLMRVHGPGLALDPRCDPSACAGFDQRAPTETCIASCEDLFVPRLLPGDAPFDAPGCEGLSFFECYAALDWDLGANTPAAVTLGDRDLLLLPAKDGGVYLVDGEHLGTMHDRTTLVAACGSEGAHCEAQWAGMMVTQPAVTEVDGAPLAIVATFMPDDRHPAGLVGLRVIDEGGAPRLERAWEYPPFESEEARTRFRRHPSGVRVVERAGAIYAVVVEQGRLGQMNGVLHVVRADDGGLAARAELGGPGQRYAVPLAIADRLFVPSCDQGNSGPGRIEAWDLVDAP